MATEMRFSAFIFCHLQIFPSLSFIFISHFHNVCAQCANIKIFHHKRILKWAKWGRAIRRKFSWHLVLLNVFEVEAQMDVICKRGKLQRKRWKNVENHNWIFYCKYLIMIFLWNYKILRFKSLILISLSHKVLGLKFLSKFKVQILKPKLLQFLN